MNGRTDSQWLTITVNYHAAMGNDRDITQMTRIPLST
jgi:hypothetical protein